jgi:DNA invertase Pin-like site-specific DNA recombinase
VSTEEQNLDLQLHALKAAGCDLIFKDEGVSAIARRRPDFEKAMAKLCPLDTFVVWKLDRAFRSLRHSLDTLDAFERRKISFQSLTEHIDTSTPFGQAMYQIQNVFSELERKLISERTKAGMEAARRNGKILGRPRKLTDEELSWASSAIGQRELTIEQAAGKLLVSPNSLIRVLGAA